MIISHHGVIHKNWTHIPWILSSTEFAKTQGYTDIIAKLLFNSKTEIRTEGENCIILSTLISRVVNMRQPRINIRIHRMWDNSQVKHYIGFPDLKAVPEDPYMLITDKDDVLHAFIEKAFEEVYPGDEINSIIEELLRA